VGKAAARRIIGEKLRKRVVVEPNDLTATTPMMVDSFMKSIQEIRKKHVRRLGLGPNILAVKAAGRELKDQRRGIVLCGECVILFSSKVVAKKLFSKVNIFHKKQK
jgi:hypothetical protein